MSLRELRLIRFDVLQIPLWKQKAGVGGEDNLVVWDYHVILILMADPCALVYDQDSLLPFPCPFPEYLSLIHI